MSIITKVKIDKQKINRILSKAFTEAVEQLVIDSQSTIADDRWEWPRQTKRRNGDVVGSPRDIVDTAQLFDSLVVSQQGNKAELTWEAPYAVIAHEGATTKNGTEIPARRWVDATIQETTAGKVFERGVAKQLM